MTLRENKLRDWVMRNRFAVLGTWVVISVAVQAVVR